MCVSQRAPIAGVGVGLRGPHLPWIAEHRPEVPWFEALADNHLRPAGLQWRQLELVRRDYPLTLHCVGMPLGGTDPLDRDYLARLRVLIERFEPAWVSDHVSFSSVDGRHFHDLLPLPFTEEALGHLSWRIEQVQEMLGRPILVENPSAYLRFAESTLPEAEFLNALCRRSGCGLLVDVNNAYVNQFNHGESARDFLARLDPQFVRQAHLAGFDDRGDYLLDAHNHPVSEPVWGLFAEFSRLFPGVPTLIEWDNDLPEFPVLMSEQQRAVRVIEQDAVQAPG